MERLGVNVDTKAVVHNGDLITATPDLKKWYLVGTDAPLGQRSKKMCISSAGINLEINDYRRNGKPTVTVYSFDESKALAHCKSMADWAKNCAPLSEMITRMQSRFSERIALQGVTDKKNLFVLVANPSNKNDHRTLSTAASGATIIVRSGEKFSFSKWILSVLDKR